MSGVDTILQKQGKYSSSIYYIKHELTFYSISHSPKGWTDQELGSSWLEKVFDPHTAARNKTGRHRLLVLDGHNSHTTYRFCSYAARHNILVMCLPPHTTHRLQPCDVGVFGPLNSTWKAEVNEASRNCEPIRKGNLLKHYAKAREKAFTATTIKHAFEKCGIWPYNPNVIEEAAFAPALNTTTQAAQPVATTIPDFVTVIPPASSPTPSPIPSAALSLAPSAVSTSLSMSSPSVTVSDDDSVVPQSTVTPSDGVETQIASSSTIYEPTFKLTVPRRLGPLAGRTALTAQNEVLRYLLDQACYQMQKDYALKKLMDKENERLRKQLYNKKNTPKKKERTGLARHMTDEDNIIELLKDEWVACLKELVKCPRYKAIKANILQIERVQAAEVAEREREALRLEKQQEKEREKGRRAVERFRLEQERQRERERKKAVREETKRHKAAEAAAAKAKKAALAQSRRKAKPHTKNSNQISPPTSDDGDANENGSKLPEAPTQLIAHPPTKPRPKPRPKRHQISDAVGVGDADSNSHDLNMLGAEIAEGEQSAEDAGQVERAIDGPSQPQVNIDLEPDNRAGPSSVPVRRSTRHRA